MSFGTIIILFLLGSSVFVTWFTAVAHYEKDYRKPIIILAMVLIISVTFGILYGGYDIFSKITINCYKTPGCDVGNLSFINNIIEEYEMDLAKDIVQNKLRDK